MKKLKRIFKKDTLRRAGYFTLAGILPLFSIITIVLNAYALESSPLNINNIKADYDNSARAEHALYKLYQCANNEGGDERYGMFYYKYPDGAWNDGDFTVTEQTAFICEWPVEEATKPHTPGDINGDGKVNNRDLTRLAQHLAGKNVECVEAALDVNGDGKVNNKDLTRLAQYLAGKNVELY